MENVTGQSNSQGESRMDRFKRHFNPLVLIFFTSTCFAMFKMVKASRAQDALQFQKYQRLRIFTSGGVVVSLLGGWGLQNKDRLKVDMKEILERFKL